MTREMLDNPNPPEAGPDEIKAKPATFGGLRRSAILEIGLFLGAAVAADYLFLDGTRFGTVAPHPFWVLILLVSVQYGTNEGMLAAAAATVALLVNNLPEQNFSQDMYAYLFHITITPILWFVAALVFGQLRLRQIRQLEELRRDLAAAETRESTIAAAYERLSQAKNLLETRIAGQVRTGITLSQAAKAIEKLEPSEVLLGVVDVVRAIMVPEKFSLYMLRNDSLEVAVQEGWTANDKFSPRFLAGGGLFQQIIGRQRVLCSVNAKDEQFLGAEGILAGPLVSAETGGVLGMLKIERLGFLDLNFNSVHTFQFLCEWIAAAYANALRYQVAQSNSVLDYETQLLSRTFFSRQTSFLGELAERIGFDLSMIVVRLENAADLTKEQLIQIPIVLGQAARKALRRSDLTFDYQKNQWEFAIVLPGTSLENIPIIADKLLCELKTRLENETPPARFSIAAHTLHKAEREEAQGIVILSPELFRRQTESMVRLAQRVAFDLSMIAFRLENPDDLTEQDRQRVPEVMQQTIETAVPWSDPAFAYQRSSQEFSIVLPTASLQTAQRVADRLLEEATRHPPDKAGKARFSCTVQALYRQRKLEPSHV